MLEPGKKVSVIVVSYNSLDHIDTCISSVLSQTYPDFEVVFVDNNSTDDSLSYAKTKFPNLIFVSNTENLGYAGGVYSGLASASGQFIAPLNIDTEVAADWLYYMASFLTQNPGVAAVTPKILLFDNRSKINALGANIHISGLSFCRKLYEEDDNLTEPQRVIGLSGCSYLIRREVFEQISSAVGQWDLAPFSDDVIVSWLTKLMGYDIYCIPKAVVYHKYNLKIHPDKFYHLERTRYLLLLSTLQPLSIFLSLPFLVVIELLIMLYSLMKGWQYVKAKMRALGSIFRQFHSVRERRPGYQRLRQISDYRLLKSLSWNLEWRQLFRTLD